MKVFLGVLFSLSLAVVGVACISYGAIETPALEPGSTPTAMPTLTPTPTPTPTPMPTPTPTPMPTPTPIPMPVPTSTPTPSAAEGDLSTVEVVKKIVPSVVNIVTESVQLDRFLREVPVQGAGTGIIFNTDGHIVTNNHVVDGARQITVTLSDGRSFPAQLVGGDVFTDLAVIKVEALGLVPAEFGESVALDVGVDVVAVGHAFNLSGGPTVTKGVVSAKGRSIQVSDEVTLYDVIQTDAAINPGNSGGPLVNMRGLVVGINSARLQAGEGLGFAIGINAARPVISDLVQFGSVRRALLGIQPVSMTPAIARRFGLSMSDGIIVAAVSPDSPAEKAGLRQADVIVRIGALEITNTSDLVKALRRYKGGDQEVVIFFRDGKEQSVSITFGSIR